MTRILLTEPSASAPPPAVSAQDHTAAEDFEFVLGKRQVASLAFVLLVILSMCSGVAYLVGKGSHQPVAPTTPVSQQIPAQAPPPMIQATVVPPAKAVEPPLFADPVPRAIYIQLGALEKGMAVILAEGLRKRGYDAFVAPGPNDKIFRIVVGPFRNQEAYQSAKNSLDSLGLSNFTRRYEK